MNATTGGVRRHTTKPLMSSIRRTITITHPGQAKDAGLLPNRCLVRTVDVLVVQVQQLTPDLLPVGWDEVRRNELGLLQDDPEALAFNDAVGDIFAMKKIRDGHFQLGVV